MMLRWCNNFDGTTRWFRDRDVANVTAEMQLLLILGAEMVIV
jgi:hypothetical protein